MTTKVKKKSAKKEEAFSYSEEDEEFILDDDSDMECDIGKEEAEYTTVSLSRLLQSPKLDLEKATEATEDTKCILQNKRSNAESVFSKLYYEAKKISEQLDIELKMPRIVSRQNQSANYPEEYFQRSVYLPVLDNILTDLARAKRSFSALKSLKTWLRNRTSEERLTGLALTNVHPEISLDVDAIIERFAKSDRRKEYIL
ncbi:unnamed protein product [Diabrotica balteata]|uniref:Uncharacterized protein n=1 Tax=Diabrotica balteata TaxID=107213 RepID=A0A9N9SPZ0_DIABA|nr:unnamed protein product [Diabrotica balteata]